MKNPLISCISFLLASACHGHPVSSRLAYGSASMITGVSWLLPVSMIDKTLRI